MIDFWNRKKRKAVEAEQKQAALELQKRKEREQAKREQKVSRNLTKTAAVQADSVDLLTQVQATAQHSHTIMDTVIAKLTGFQKLFDETQKVQAQQQEKQTQLSQWEEDVKNRLEAVRKEEMSVHVRSEGVRQEEKRVAKKDADLDSERERIQEERKQIKAREEKSAQTEKDAEVAKEKAERAQKEATTQKKAYEDKLADLDAREAACKERETASTEHATELDELRAALEKEKAAFEESRAKIESGLAEKEKELDRKIADADALDETLKNVGLDDSEDGKKAKIVVKEAIRQIKKRLEDSIAEINTIDEKYNGGTFKGFSIPLDEINTEFEQCKVQYVAVKEAVASAGELFAPWLQCIETYIADADTCQKAHNFTDAYRNTLFALAYCEGCGTAIEIINAYISSGAADDGADTAGEGDAFTDDGEWFDCYEVLFGDDFDPSTDYTAKTEKELKKQYRTMAKRFHPDRADDEHRAEYEEMTKRLNAAWETLSDTDKRAAYDAQYHEHRRADKKAA